MLHGGGGPKNPQEEGKTSLELPAQVPKIWKKNRSERKPSNFCRTRAQTALDDVQFFDATRHCLKWAINIKYLSMINQASKATCCCYTFLLRFSLLPILNYVRRIGRIFVLFNLTHSDESKKPTSHKVIFAPKLLINDKNISHFFKKRHCLEETLTGTENREKSGIFWNKIFT